MNVSRAAINHSVIISNLYKSKEATFGNMAAPTTRRSGILEAKSGQTLVSALIQSLDEMISSHTKRSGTRISRLFV